MNSTTVIPNKSYVRNLLIVMILLAVSYSYYTDMRDRNEAKNEIKILVTQIQEAQTKAVSENKCIEFAFLNYSSDWSMIISKEGIDQTLSAFHFNNPKIYFSKGAYNDSVSFDKSVNPNKKTIIPIQYLDYEYDIIIEKDGSIITKELR